MKKQRLKFKLLTTLLLGLFILLAVYGTYSVTTYGTRWFSSRWNTRIRTQKENVTAGDILDRNGIVLAHTENGRRVYQSDTAARSAVVHLIGDSEGMIANGVETFQTEYLYGFRSSLGEQLSQLISGRERTGDNVKLTIDSVLCTRIVQSFSSRSASRGKNGAAVVMNWQTGEMLALVSLPVFDPMAITDAVRDAPGQPFWNRAAQAVCTPGSTFKTVTAASGLENLAGLENEMLHCSGILDTDGQGHTVTDYNHAIHGDITVRQALAVSCNNAFAQLALHLGDDTLRKTALNFGFNDNFLFRDIVVENSTYPAERNRSRFDIAWSGVGQSKVTATPVHMCMIASAVANSGTMLEPRLLLSVDSPSGNNRLHYTSSVYRTAMKPETAAFLRGAMRDVVTSGTGTAANISGMAICGKTGSAETSINGAYATNAWFIGFNADESLPVAVCVLVEDVGDGQGGGSAAAPIAADIFTYLREHREQVTGTIVYDAPQWDLNSLLTQAQNLWEQASSLVSRIGQPTPEPTAVPTASPTPLSTASPVPAPTTFVDVVIDGAQGIVQDTVQGIVNDVVGGIINSQ